MAPIKFEENIKDKLEKRTIQPSADAWQTLASRLDAKNNKKKSPYYLWLGVAASIVAIMFIASQLFVNNNNTTIETPVIVNTNKETIKKVESENVLQKKDVLTNNVEKESVKELNIKTPKSEKTEVALLTKQKEEKTVLPKEVIVNKTSFEDLKVQQVVAQIQGLKDKGESVTDKDIDALLDQAQKEITLQNIYNETTKTVDANALLQDVESDLQQSFRDKVFNALKSSYNTVKTAVAERNN
ncbi:hypothetical protein GCM10011531_25850 [Aquaticitalea lipolytica]|jgi:preprotein translocase subunit SecD|uniref:Anti-sigma factor n=1 Tax=Aquaticitalea lipolytica TaxID=1247562 RepID=A0A8J2TT52_9FLAO|nr:hypothetical protein [Aquaticitalea lipolytica]GFZ92832.1 hypothetical protein GCM10011531_25850 [Aquaticitalea lipolytica]